MFLLSDNHVRCVQKNLDLVGGGESHGREDAGAQDAGERERTHKGKAREARPGSRKTFLCVRDCCFGEPHALVIVAERQNQENRLPYFT
jgi:hypothetical protein